MTREQRWEARKQAKFTQAEVPTGPPQFAYPDEEIKVAASNPSFQQQYYENRGSPVNSYAPPPQNYIPDTSIQHLNPISYANENPSYMQKQKTPPSSSFFLNPVSEAEEKRQKALQMYKNEAIQNISLPPRKVRERPSSRTQVIDSAPSDESLRKKAYALELQQQMLEKRETKIKRNSGQGDYFPFGKPGAGAPFRDTSGNIIAVRPPKYNENDPKFLSPNDFYKKSSPGMNRYSSQPEMQIYREQPQFSHQEAPPPPQYAQAYPPQYMPQQYMQQYPPNIPPQAYSQAFNSPQGVNSQAFNPQGYGGQGFNPPAYNPPAYNNPQGPGYPPQYGNSRSPDPSHFQEEFKPPPAGTFPRADLNQSMSPSESPRPGAFGDSQLDQEKMMAKNKKEQLARTLLEQMDEKKRQREEERRQKVLEERLEEERLARQRREIEEGYKREAMNKRKQIQDLQEFNANAKVSVVEAKSSVQRKPRTPIEMPPPMLPAPRSRETNEARFHFQPAQELTVESQGRQHVLVETQGRENMFIETEFTKIKNDLSSHQNDMKNEILKLKSQNLEANEHRFEAQKELDRLKEEMRRKSLMEDIRQKELLSALVNTKNTLYDSNTKLPVFKPTAYKLPSSRSEASLSLDSMKSLPSQTKLIPLALVEPNFPTKSRPDSNEKFKKALNLDSIFPSLPDSSPNNISFEPIHTANSSIGIDNVNKRNEHRLKVLDRFDSNPGDELNKLDDMLFKYLEDSATRKPDTVKKNNREYKLLSIEEEEADLSLPRSMASDDISLKWYKD